MISDQKQKWLDEYISIHGEATTICPNCGKRRKAIIGKGDKFYFSKCCMSGICHPNYNKKRPEHSAIMKQRTADGKNPTSFQKGVSNSFINTIEWKRRVLDNKHIEHTHLSDNELIDFFNKYKSDIAKSRSVKLSKTKTQVKKYSEYLLKLGPLPIIKEDITDDELDYWFKITNGVKTLVTVKNGTAKRYKRTKFFDLEYNTKSKSITTKSSYETNYVLLFEDTATSWEYEPFILKDGRNLYLPDFIFEYSGQKYMLEVKGFFKDTEQQTEYFMNKLNLAQKWCNENNYILLFTLQGKPTTIENLIEERYVSN